MAENKKIRIECNDLDGEAKLRYYKERSVFDPRRFEKNLIHGLQEH